MDIGFCCSIVYLFILVGLFVDWVDVYNVIKVMFMYIFNYCVICVEIWCKVCLNYCILLFKGYLMYCVILGNFCIVYEYIYWFKVCFNLWNCFFGFFEVWYIKFYCCDFCMFGKFLCGLIIFIIVSNYCIVCGF